MRTANNLLFTFLLLAAVVACAPPSGPGTPGRPAEGTPAPVQTQSLKPKICSFNIQFLGNSKIRDNKALAKVVANSQCTMVIVQEIVAPPDIALVANTPEQKLKPVLKLPDGRETKPQPMVTDFFLAMQAEGFDRFWLSEEDTGPVETNNNNGSATEWWAVFYRSDTWTEDRSLPHGFLDSDVTNNPTYDRVPYAFSFKSVLGGFDFVVVSVHLRPGAEAVNKVRRSQEIKGIVDWIESQKKGTNERDFLIAGDCNLEDGPELIANELPSLKSLNVGSMFMTNTNRNAPKPYDHVFVSPEDSKEISLQNNFEVIDLVVKAQPFWERASKEEYPGGLNYNHNLFRFYYSDHLPVAFLVDLPERDDD